MMDTELIALLQCPQTGQQLSLDRDPANLKVVNSRIANGQLGLASGESLDRPVDALLYSADRTISYPVSDGVACLLAESALMASSQSGPAHRGALGDAEIQRRQMAKYSEVYERWTGGEGGITRATQKILHQRYGSLFTDATVLDIGNGGTPPEVQLGPEIAGVVERFVAADRSSHMLRRSGNFGDQVLANAFRLPFKSNSVDIVTVNNTIHHFGRHRGEDPQRKLQAFFSEAMRVARKGVIGVELLVPSWAEAIERLLLYPAGFLPTFVYSTPFYENAFRNAGMKVADFEVRSLGQLTSPWKVIPPVLDFTWLRVPTFMVPYSFLFFSIEKKGSMAEAQ